MHYVRLLRPPILDASDPNNASLSITMTITTDLGDAFLNAGAPVDIMVTGRHSGGASAMDFTLRPFDNPNQNPRVPVGVWQDGMRVLKSKLKFPKDYLQFTADVEIWAMVHGQPRTKLNNSSEVFSWAWTSPAGDRVDIGNIMPVHVVFDHGVLAEGCHRKLRLVASRVPDMLALEIEEDIGESIARHIWDAGLMTALFLALSCTTKGKGFGIKEFLPITTGGLNILELGCGVGILGLAVATLVSKFAEAQGMVLEHANVLLTDVPEAEERAKANILRLRESLRYVADPAKSAMIKYENLDWDDGKEGQFGPLASSRSWDYIILSDCTYNVDSLPALCGTLSALHRVNVRHSPSSSGEEIISKVILATKPRHESEKALFEILTAEGWSHRLLKSLPLPKLGEEDEVVEMYMLQMKGEPLQQTRKRKLSSDQDLVASKRVATESGTKEDESRVRTGSE